MPQILSTAHIPFSPSHPEMVLHCLNFIAIDYEQSPENIKLYNSIAHKNITAIFTSSHAVKAVFSYIQPQNWDIFCLDNSTKDALIAVGLGEQIVATAPNAQALALEIIKSNFNIEHPTYFFCSNMRLNTLPYALKRFKVTPIEVIAYTTRLTPQSIDTAPYSGILFYSPSGVNSFFTNNTVLPHTTLFSIGTTTTEALQKHSDNKIITIDYPSKKELLATAENYLLQQQTILI
ncbi:MAG: uroporphyrinogen-III synthase [Chitinophagia bacterium]|nr:uroporphyrinogen-III synthase [Chitinophagia bacterium]